MRHAASHAQRALRVRFTYRAMPVYVKKRERERSERERVCSARWKKSGWAGEQAGGKKKEKNESCRCSLAFRRTYIAYMSELPKEPLVRAMNGFSGARCRCKQMLLYARARAWRSHGRVVT